MTTAIWLSLSVGVAATIISLAPAVAVAWVLERTRLPGRGIIQTIAMLPLVLPPAVTGYVLLSAFSQRGPLAFLHVASSWWGAVVAAAAVGFPLLVLNITLAMKAVDPRLETISRSLGRTRWQTFWRVTFPLCRPGLIAGAILAFARGLGEFGATIVLAGRISGKTETISLAMYRFLDEPDGTPKVVTLSIVSVAICFAAVLASRSLEDWYRRRLEIER